jgi:hypothetical protein
MLTRREFVTAIAAGGAFAAMPAAMWPASLPALVPVVSIHMDQLYVDATGRAKPYEPPNGLRSAAPIAHLSELEFRRRFVYL